MTMKKLLYIALISIFWFAGCEKPADPQPQPKPEPDTEQQQPEQQEPENEDPAAEAIGKYIYNGKEYPINSAFYADGGNTIMLRISPLETTASTTYAIIGINASLEGREINVDTAWNNDDYYFRYEDPVMYYSEYRKPLSGTICISRDPDADNIFTLKTDIILPDGKEFKAELLSTEFEPYS